MKLSTVTGAFRAPYLGSVVKIHPVIERKHCRSASIRARNKARLLQLVRLPTLKCSTSPLQPVSGVPGIGFVVRYCTQKALCVLRRAWWYSRQKGDV